MTEKGQSWLLHPQLRGVLEQHIVPESRCLLLRYTLSRVCRDLWLRLRSDDFLRFARVVRGNDSTWLAFNLLAGDIKERYIRSMCPDVCAQFPVGNAKFWCRFFSTSSKKASINIGFTPEFGVAHNLTGNIYNASPCPCSTCRSCNDGFFWYLDWKSDRKELYLTKL